MPTETVSLEWMGSQVFELKDRAGFSILMTQPEGVNGADLLPLSLIGCSAWDVIAVLRKQHQQVASLQVSATSERDNTPPWRFRKIHVLYRFSGTSLSEKAIQRAIELSEGKYCSTYATLRDAVEIDSRFQIMSKDTPTQEDGLPEISIFTPAAAGPVTINAAAARAAKADATPGIVRRFNDALNEGNVDEMMRLVTEDCIFENTFPAPEGTLYTGRQQVREFWETFFRNSLAPHVEIEELFALGERCVMRWIYHWQEHSGQPGYVRGVDIYKIRAGLIAEKLSYVKG